MMNAESGVACDALLKTLMHSLWQAVAAALVLRLLLRRLPASACRLRYGLSCGALATVVIASLVTWSVIRSYEPRVRSFAAEDPARISATLHPAAEHTAPELSAALRPVETAVAKGPTEQSAESWAPAVIFVWCLGVVVMLSRALRSFIEVRRRRSPAEDLSGVIMQLQAELCDVAEVCGIRRPVRLVAVDHLMSPAVIGIIRPVILVPICLLTGNALSVDQWRVVFAHELAHVRRLDGVTNLVQILAESVYFFSPAVWWISRRIRAEREACCDLFAVHGLGSNGGFRSHDNPAELSLAGALVSVAQVVALSRRTPVTVTALDGGESKSELRDRVERITDPGQVPSAALSWIGGAAMLAAVIGAFILLQRGTDQAVRSALAMLSDRERIDEFARMQAEYSGIVVPEADQDSGAPSEGNGDGEAEDADNSVTVFVEVRIPPGDSITGPLSVTSIHRQQSRSRIASEFIGVGPEQELSRRLSFAPGMVRLFVSAEGYQPACSEILTLLPGTSEQHVIMTLSRGFEASLLLTDEQDNPLDGVRAVIHPMAELDGSSGGFSYHNLEEASVDGRILIPHASAETPYRIQAAAPGFAFLEKTVQFSDKAEVRIRLQESDPVRMRISDSETGEPVQAAEVRLAGRSSSRQAEPVLRIGDPRELSLRHASLLGESGADGMVTADMLSADELVLVAVVAKGYQPQIVGPLRGGTNLPEVRLMRSYSVLGRVTGDLTGLPVRREAGSTTRVLRYRNPFRYRDSSYSAIFETEVDDAGQFVISNLVSPDLTVISGSQSQHIELSDAGSEIEINWDDLSAEPVMPVERPFRVSITGLPSKLIPRGVIRASWYLEDDYKAAELPLTEGSASGSAPIGSRLHLEPEGLVGCLAEEPDPIVIEPGSGPIVIPISAVPAGALLGQAHRPDGTAARSASFIVFAEEPADERNAGRLNPSSSSLADRFFRSVPLGGTYIIAAVESTEDHWLWSVSEPYRVNEDNPAAEVKLQLSDGDPLKVRISDPEGHPVEGARVSVRTQLRHSTMSRSFRRDRVTDGSGIADFGRVTPPTEVGPVAVSRIIEISPTERLIGRTLDDPGTKSVIEMQLQEGVSVEGVLVEADTGFSIPDAEIRLLPKASDTAAFREEVRGRTDNFGRFRIGGLEPITYVGFVEGAVEKSAVLDARPDGSVRISYPKGNSQMLIEAGSAAPVRWEVRVIPGHGLTPTPTRH